MLYNGKIGEVKNAEFDFMTTCVYKSKVIYDDFNVTKSAAKEMIQLETMG